MKLSEAIRQGATLRPQVKRLMFGPLQVEGETIYGSCALGAAFEGLGGKVEECDGNISALNYLIWKQNRTDEETLFRREFWPKGSSWYGAHYTDTLDTIIAHLNDKDNWTREQIADWLETIGL